MHTFYKSSCVRIVLLIIALHAWRHASVLTKNTRKPVVARCHTARRRGVSGRAVLLLAREHFGREHGQCSVSQ